MASPAGYWIDPGPRPGFENMALDQALLELAEATGATRWRLYRWDPWCLSFGRHEPAARRYDRARIEALGIHCVRRPTGGRAVWHARELTYSVAGPLLRGETLAATYRRIHETLAAAVRSLGGAALLAPARAAPGLSNGACFSAAVGGEVVVDARKVIGSAQYRGARGFLQHGSLLLEDDQSVVRSLQLEGDPGPAQETTLSEVAGRTIGFGEAADAVATALAAAGRVAPMKPEEGLAEVDRRARLHFATYRSAAWTWQR